MQYRVNVLSSQFRAAVQEVQLDQKRDADDLAARFSGEIDRGLRRPAGRQHVVDDQDAFLRGARVLVNLERILAVLEAVGLLVRRAGQLAGLAHRHEAAAERGGDGGAENEAPALDADHLIDVLTHVRRGEGIDRVLKSLAVAQQGGDVVKEDALLRKVRNLANLRFQVIHSAIGAPLSNVKSRVALIRIDLVDQHLLDARARWPAAQRALESIDRFTLAFRHGFNAAVVAVEDVAVQAFAARGIMRKIAKAHGLHTPAQDESPSYAHPAILSQ